MSKANIELLKKSIEQDYEDFHTEVLAMSKEDIFNNARDISTVEDVLFFMSTHDWLTEDEAECLLSQGCPLASMAVAWEGYRDNEAVDFRKALDSLLGPGEGVLGDVIYIGDDDWSPVDEE